MPHLGGNDAFARLKSFGHARHELSRSAPRFMYLDKMEEKIMFSFLIRVLIAILSGGTNGTPPRSGR